MTTKRKKTGLFLLVSLIVLAWLAVMVWLAQQPQRTEGSLGIDDETNHGAAAVTSVLEEHGIRVRPAQSMTQLESELRRNPDATVLFHDKYQAMQTASFERMEQLAALVPAEQRVFAGVADAQQRYLVDDVEGTTNIGFTDQLEASDQCRLDAAREAGSVSSIRQGVMLTDDAEGCFRVIDESTGEAQESYAFAQTADGSVIFADWRMLTNSGLYQNGTATLAIWSLGRTDTVIWFQPDFQLDPDTDGQLSPVQLPDWARMSLVWAVIATGIWLLYRARRTGPIITEPLPAEVPAAETTVGRGRLYAKAKHHRHALTMLQRASVSRLARLLQLGSQASPEAVLAEAAKQLDRSLAELQQLYTPPAHDISAQQFVSWANQLQDLEYQVRNRFIAPTKES